MIDNTESGEPGKAFVKTEQGSSGLFSLQHLERLQYCTKWFISLTDFSNNFFAGIPPTA